MSTSQEQPEAQPSLISSAGRDTQRHRARTRQQARRDPDTAWPAEAPSQASTGTARAEFDVPSELSVVCTQVPDAAQAARAVATGVPTTRAARTPPRQHPRVSC